MKTLQKGIIFFVAMFLYFFNSFSPVSASTWSQIVTSNSNVYSNSVDNSLYTVLYGSFISVKKFDGSSWNFVGAQSFADCLCDSQQFDLAFHPVTGEPYIAYRDTDASSAHVTVKKFDGSSWVNVGSSKFSRGVINSVKISFNPITNEPYVIFNNFDTNTNYLVEYDAIVMKFNGTSWVTIGDENDFSDDVRFPGISFDLVTGDPYVVYSDMDIARKVVVKKFNGTSWSAVGSLGISEAAADYTKILFNPETNEPYVAYIDVENSNKPTVMKFNGTSWEPIGKPGFANYSGYNTYTIDFDIKFRPGSNELYLTHDGGGYPNTKKSLMKYNGLSWKDTEDADFLTSANFNSLAFSSSTGKMYLGLSYHPSVGSGIVEFPLVAETPVPSVASGTYTGVQSVSLTSKTQGATIYYTTDGTTPTQSSNLYSSPINASSSLTLKAIAIKSGLPDSDILVESYSILDNKAVKPEAYHPTGTFRNTQLITLTTNTSGATIYYTTDGATPTQSSSVYSGPVNISTSITLKAIAVKSGLSDSDVMTEVYTISKWANVGEEFFSTGAVNYVDIAFNPSTNEPYVSYSDYSTSVYGPTVKKFSGSSWETVGTEGFSATRMDNSKIEFNPATNEPYLLGGYGTMSLFKFNGSSWVTVGSTISQTSYYSLAFNPSTNEPYAAYADYSSGRNGKVTVKKFDGSSWVSVGSEGFSSSIAYDKITLKFNEVDGFPYVAYSNGNYTTVSKFDGTSWVNVWSSALNEYGRIYFDINQTTGHMYVFLDSSYLFEFDGTSWVEQLQSDYLSAINNLFINQVTGDVYVLYQDYMLTGRSSIKKYNGTSWSDVDTASFSTNGVRDFAPAFHPVTNDLYVVYGDYNSPNRVSVKYLPTTVVSVPTPSVLSGTFYNNQSVELSSETATSTIYYTTDGSSPTSSSTLYSSAITISSDITLKAIAIKDGTESSVMVETYLFKVATTTASVTGGTFNSDQEVTLSSVTSTSTIYYTTDGSTPTSTSTQYSGPITVASSTTLKAIGIKSLYADSEIMTEVYTLQVATPTPSVAGGTYAGSQSITLSSGATSTTFYYTTDGSTPTATSTLYSSGITISSTTTLKVIAVKSGYSDSEIMSESYFITLPQVEIPTVSVSGGTFNSDQEVTLSSVTSTTTIYYTTDGSTPTSTSTLYTGAIIIATSTTLKAIGIKSEYSNSLIMSELYTFITATPTPSVSGGTFGTTQSVSLTSSTTGVTIYYTTDGSTPNSSSTVYGSTLNIASSTVLKVIATKSGYSDSDVITEIYTFQAATPTASPTGLTSSSSQSITLSSATAESLIYYTIDGSTPTISSTLYSSVITATSTQTIKAIAVKPGYTNSSVMTESYTVHPQAEIPTASPVGGSSSSTISVTLASNTATSSIYYTTNGTIPTTGSTLYTGPISVSSSQTLKAIATKSGYTNSDVMSEDYTIASQVIVPTASVSGGVFYNNQSVTLSSVTATSTIYYTVDGSTPTTSSILYTGEIIISASTTLKAIAVKNLFTDSGVMTESYILQTATPTPSTVGGTYADDQSIVLTSGTTGATVYYTLDGTTPSATSTIYSVAIQISSTTTIKAVAVKSGYADSDISSDAYVISSNVATITSNNYTVSTSGTSSRVISDMPYGTSKAVFLSGLTKGQYGQVWNSTGVQDPAISGNTLVVTSQDATNQITYTLSVDSLTSNQTVPDGSGIVTISTTTPEVVVTDASQQVSVTVSTSTLNPTINIGAFIVNGTGTIPSIIITSLNADNTVLSISTSTLITSASTTWDGVINAPATTTITLPTESGQTKTLSTAIEVGLPGERLVFNKAVRILLPNQANKRAGYVSTSTFTEITTTCSSDSQSSGDSLSDEGECKVDNGSDLVIWTKHFTTFATYSQVTTPVSSGSVSSISGGGGYFVYNSPTPSYSGGGSSSTSNVTSPTILASGNTNSNMNTNTSSSNNITTNQIATTEILSFGSEGKDVEKLQEFLFNNGYLSAEPNGRFGPATEKAVKRFQAKYADELLTPQGFKNPTGMVGDATRNKINDMIALKGKDVSSSPIAPSSNNTSSRKITTTEILTFGSEGNDVEVLQVFLFNNDFLSAQPNGHFGPATEKAVKRFQAKYADELLTPQGFKNPTGMVGDATRTKINELIKIQ